MSALQCPTRIFVARHGEAEYETTAVTDDGGSLTARGRRQARELARTLRGERIAGIWCSPLSRAVQTAEIVAAELTIPGGERVCDVVERVGAVLREIADQHPGEAVLVVGHGGAILTAVPELVGRRRVSAYDLTLPNAGHVELEVDAEGWRLVRFDEAMT